MTARPIFALVSLVLIGGATLLLFFVVLAGAINSFPVNTYYFLEADTSSIPNAPPLSRWTIWNVCGGSSDGYNVNCGAPSPAFPFDPPTNFGTTQGINEGFVGTNKFWYMTRFLFAFILISLFFSVAALLLGFLALCSRIGSYLSSVMAALALLFQTAVASLMTAAYVIGRNNFLASNQTATIGRFNFGYMWAAMICLLLATILLCLGGAASRKDTTYSRRSGFLGRKKSTRSRGSFIDNDASSFVRA